MTSCEWFPGGDRPAFAHEHHADATTVVGADGQWHLCDGCAALPRFRRFTSRRRLPTTAPERRQE